MLIKTKTLTRLPGDHKRGIDPGVPIFHGFKTETNCVPRYNFSALRLSR